MTKKILVVEDSPLLQKIIRGTLKSAGYAVYDDANGRNALISIHEVSPDLLVLDIWMPVMDGMTTYDELRKLEQWQNLPVIMLTSSNDAEIEAWLKARNLTCVMKDDNMIENLLSAIEKTLADV